MAEVAVVGGGLAGLVAARHLAAEGTDVTLFERRDEVGGRVRSVHEDGFVYDRGFQVLFPAYPAVQRELDLDALDLGRFAPGATLARPGRRSVLADPRRNPRALAATVFNRDVTTRDKVRVLRLARELRRTPVADLRDRDDASIRAFLRDRGFSAGFVERFAAPLYGGITLDRSLATSRYVFEYTFKMLAESRAALPAEGMQAVPEQLATSARADGATIERGFPVADVEPMGNGVAVSLDAETIAADAAVVATDPPAATELTGCAAIPTEGVGCVTQYFSLERTRAFPGQDRLVLDVADDGPNHVAVHSAAAPAYAPAGRHLLSATYLGTPDVDDGTLAERTRAALESWYPEQRFDSLEHRRTVRVPFAQLAQPPGFLADRPAVDEPSGPIYLAGGYTRWSSIQGAMESGREAASVLLEEERRS